MVVRKGVMKYAAGLSHVKIKMGQSIQEWAK